MKQQLTTLKNWLKKENNDAVFFNDPATIAYLTGYQSDPHERIMALIVFQEKDPFLFTPALDVEDAKNSMWSYPVFGYADNEDPWKKIASHVTDSLLNLKSLAVEKDYLTVGKLEELQKLYPSVSFTDISPTIQDIQLIKSDDELQVMHEAGKWADRALEIGFNAITKGKTELEIVAEIEFQLKKLGVSEMSFDTMVLTGNNAASPHGIPGQSKIKPGDFVLFDLGVVWKGYTSDVSRTVSYGKVSEEAEFIYTTVLKAQEAALAAVKPGVKASQLDKIARDIITEAGYGDYFTHRLGHGLGSSVHEYPSIKEGNDMVIREGMCFSIEPGIYVPGVAGVRIEDCLHVTKDGYRLFTHTPKSFTTIKNNKKII